MRVVVVGGSGNVGTSVISALGGDERVESILGLARRRPSWQPEKTEWDVADITRDDLVPHFRGADAVVHLAWAIQPSRDGAELRRVNVGGSERVFDATAEARVPALIYASSIGAYSPGPKDRGVDESWPTGGVASSFYSRHKAETESLLDRFCDEHPDVRVVRLRPGLIFKGEAATEIRRLFAGPFLPRFLVDRRLIPIVPRIAGLRAQAVHSADVGEAYRLAIVGDVRGAFNIAADPVIDAESLSGFLSARQLPVPPWLVRGLAAATWHLRLQPTPPGWLDMALAVPLMDTRRAREELGWKPRHTSLEALDELMTAMREGEGLEETPPLAPQTSGPARSHEVASGVGGRNP